MKLTALLRKSTPQATFVAGVTDCSAMKGQPVKEREQVIGHISRAWVDGDGNLMADIEMDDEWKDLFGDPPFRPDIRG